MKLTEIKKTLLEAYTQLFTNRDDIEQFVRWYCETTDATVDIDDNGLISASGNWVSFSKAARNKPGDNARMGIMPIRFKSVNCSLHLGKLGLETLDGLLPDHISGSLSLNSNFMKTLKGIPTHIDEALNIRGCQRLSLEGVGTHFKHLEELQVDAYCHNSHIIGVILIPGLKKLDVQTYAADQSQIQAWDIVKKYVGRPDSIFDCQEELIEAGLEGFAEL